MTSEVKAMSLFEWLLLIILSILWGGSFFFVGIAVEVLPPFTIVALRVSLAAIALLIVVHVTGLRMPTDRKVWLAFFGMGILNNVIPFSLIVWGQTHIGSGLASILNATTPLFTVMAAHFLTQDEKMTKLKMTGVAIGFSGVVIMIGTEALGGQGESIYGQFAVLGAAISYSLAGIYGRRFRQMGIKPLVTASGQVMASTVLLLPTALIVEQPFTLPMPGLEVWSAIAGLAVFSTAFAYILYFRILATAGATNVLLVTLLIPVSAILLGTTFLSEQFEVKHLLGMGLIGIGLLSIDGRLFKIIQNKIWIKTGKTHVVD
jgi:drug/metabolite transporter (DMT)-like permease